MFFHIAKPYARFPEGYQRESVAQLMSRLVDLTLEVLSIRDRMTDTGTTLVTNAHFMMFNSVTHKHIHTSRIHRMYRTIMWKKLFF